MSAGVSFWLLPIRFIIAVITAGPVVIYYLKKGMQTRQKEQKRCKPSSDFYVCQAAENCNNSYMY